MASLDNLDQINKLDQDGILANIQELPVQIEDCWTAWKKIAIPTHYITANRVLILGMGGSSIAGRLAKALTDKISSIPVTVLGDYDIPGWVDKHTLVIAISYSGNTEEPLEAFRQSIQKTDKLITIATGGKLASLASQHRALHFQINYGSQPRAALGYSLTSLLAIFQKLKYLELTDNDVQESLVLLKGFLAKIDAAEPTGRNMAKLLAQKLVGKIPIILASGTLAPVAVRWKQDFNENAKSASYTEVIPEMNHNSLVGTEYPRELGKYIFVIILQSAYDHERNKLRQNITAQILSRRRVGYDQIMLQPAGNILAEMFQMILLGDLTSFYLSMLNNVAPNPVEIINFLKDKLEEVPFEGKKKILK